MIEFLELSDRFHKKFAKSIVISLHKSMMQQDKINHKA